MIKEIAPINDGDNPKVVASGTIFWCKFQEGRHDRGNDRVQANYQAMFVPDDLAWFKKKNANIVDMEVEDEKYKSVQVKRKFEYGPVPIVDSKKNPIPNSEHIGNGSKVNLFFTEYYFDNKLYPKAIMLQVVDLVEFTPADGFEGADNSVFDDVEGFVFSGTKEFDDEIPF